MFNKKISDIIPTYGVYIQRYLTALDLLNKKKSFILDIGCGDGGISYFLNRCGKHIIAIDLEKKKRNFDYIIATAEKLPFKESIFDQILFLDVLEHIPKEKLVVEEINRVMKKNGNLIITTPSNFWRYPYYSFMKFIAPSEKSLMESFGHLRRGYSLLQIKKLFKNFKIEQTRYYVNKISALFFDLEYSNLHIIKNIILRVLAFPLFLNFKLPSKKWGTHIGIRLRKIK
jgi:ubiquinone/menaquinone biosynthesis C-methylase UbiE